MKWLLVQVEVGLAFGLVTFFQSPATLWFPFQIVVFAFEFCAVAGKVVTIRLFSLLHECRFLGIFVVVIHVVTILHDQKYRSSIPPLPIKPNMKNEIFEYTMLANQ